MKKIERKSSVLKLHREIVVHLTHESLRQAVGGSSNTACFGCHGGGGGGGGSTHQETDDNNLPLKH